MAVIVCCVLMLSIAGSSSQAPSKPADAPAAATLQPIPVDVNNLYVVVEAKRHPIPDPNGTKFTSQLESLIQARLEKANIRVLRQVDDAPGSAIRQATAGGSSSDSNDLRRKRLDAPILQVALNVLFLDTGSRAVVYVQTSLTQPIRLLDRRGTQTLQAAIWNTEPVMESVLATRWSDEARKLVLEQVESFAAAPRITASTASTASSGGSAGTATQTAPADSYVASKTSINFHRPSCPVVRAISVENLVIYKTREEALAAGKQPCKSCNP